MGKVGLQAATQGPSKPLLLPPPPPPLLPQHHHHPQYSQDHLQKPVVACTVAQRRVKLVSCGWLRWVGGIWVGWHRDQRVVLRAGAVEPFL